MPAFLTVTAPEGRTTPIAPNDAADPTGLVLTVTSDVVCRVRYSSDVRRAIACGDLIPCTVAGLKVDDPEKAAADVPLHTGATVTEHDIETHERETLELAGKRTTALPTGVARLPEIQ